MENGNKWTDPCLKCQAKHGGTCESEDCAKLKYDPWGDPYPLFVYGYDHDGREEYIALKRKRMEAHNNEI